MTDLLTHQVSAAGTGTTKIGSAVRAIKGSACMEVKCIDSGRDLCMETGNILGISFPNLLGSSG